MRSLFFVPAGFVDDFFQNVYHTIIVDIYIHRYMNIFIFILYISYIYINDTCIQIVYTYNTWTKYVRFLLLVAFEAEDSFERSEASQMDRDATR